MPGDIGRFMPGDIGRFMPGDIGRFIPGDIGRFIPGDIGRLIPGDIGRFMPGLIGLWGPIAGELGRGPGPACGPRAYWFRWDGLGFDGLAARHVLGTTPCWERSSRMHRA
jgi:hypothetical protein